MLLLLCPYPPDHHRADVGGGGGDDFDMAMYIKKSSNPLIVRALTTKLTQEYLDWMVGSIPPD